MKVKINVVIKENNDNSRAPFIADDPFSQNESTAFLSTKPESTGSILSIKSAELLTVIEKANSGDASFSFRLYRYFLFSKNNIIESDKWLLKAAEQGHSSAQYNLAVSFLEKKDYAKAIFWAKSSKENHSHPKADEPIKKIAESMQ